MRLQDYPRPPQDNGIGMHWSGGNPGLVGAGELRSFWIPELRRLGVKWVKLLHDGGLEFAELLMAAGIMPIVRIYRPHPNSADLTRGTLGRKDLEYLKNYASLGVKYFEFNNEPNLSTEWEGGVLPANALELVGRAAIVDMENVLAAGGYPAVPAVAVGSQWDILGTIARLGGRHLFDEPIWVAVHNYDINHPLDYPYDTVNQRGEKITKEEYERLGMAAWQGRTWRLRSRDFINEQRGKGANPGHTVLEDVSCFRAYERLALLSRQHLGRYLPILATENGPIIGEDDDPRYPSTTPALHAQKVSDIARIMMGTSETFPAAPPYLFCTAYWLMGNAMLRGVGWETHAWYSPTWPGGRLPAVEALAATPKAVRLPAQDRDNGDFDVSTPVPLFSAIAGILYDHPGARVILRGPQNYAAETTSDAHGAYRFSELGAGVYRLSVPGTQIVRTQLEVDGYIHLRVDVGAPPQAPAPTTEWQVRISESGRTPGFGAIRVTVDGKLNLPVQISTQGWAGYTQLTGTKTEYGPYALEFAPLNAGRYQIVPSGLGIEAEVALDSTRAVMVHFVPPTAAPPPPTPMQSVISGRVANGAGKTIILRGPAGERSTLVAADESYRFAGLAAGVYALVIAGSDIRQEDVQLDGIASRVIHLTFTSQPASSSIRGVAVGGAGLKVTLRGGGQQRAQVLDAEGRFSFTGLQAAVYRLTLFGALSETSTDVQVDGIHHADVNLTLQPPAAGGGWSPAISDGGASPGFAVVRVRIEGHPNVPVRLWAEGWNGIVRRTGDKPEYGPAVCEFAPLGAGTYYVEPQGFGVRAEVKADGRRVLWVTFSQAAPQPPVPPSAKTVDHCLLIGELPPDPKTYLVVLRYAARFRPSFATTLAEALKARHVTLIGSDQSIPSSTQETLTRSGSKVVRLSGSGVAEHLQKRINEGRAFP